MKLEERLQTAIHCIEDIVKELLRDPSAILNNLKEAHNGHVLAEAMLHADKLLDLANNDDVRKLLAVKMFATLLDAIVHWIAMKYLDLDSGKLDRINVELEYLRALATLRITKQMLKR